MPESMRSFGELIDEAATITSRLARTIWTFLRASISTPTARLFSIAMRRAKPLTRRTFGRFSAGFR